jgi:hypothetical protein
MGHYRILCGLLLLLLVGINSGCSNPEASNLEAAPTPRADAVPETGGGKPKNMPGAAAPTSTQDTAAAAPPQ